MSHSSVQVEESIYINTPREQLWEITALQFDQIGLWSAGVKVSEGQGKGINGAVCKERLCTPSYKGFAKTTERIIEYKPNKFEFTYSIVSGLPSMVTKATNRWTHTSQSDGTRIKMEVNMSLKGFVGKIMKGPMQKKMKKILRQNLEELKTFAETGSLHERKQKLNKKLKSN